MRIQAIYEPENIRRVKTAQIVVAIIAIGLISYIAGATLLSMREVGHVRWSLRKAKKMSAQLSRQASQQHRREGLFAKPESGGVESFAVRFSSWARLRNVRIESFAPEGPPVPGEITSDGVNLGTWNATKVRVKGLGDYNQLVSLLHEFERARTPVRLDSFVLQSAPEGGKTRVSFDLLLTVFARVGKEGMSSAAG